VAKVRIMGVVIEGYIREDGEHARLILEDGTGSISVRAWREGVSLLLDPSTRTLYPRGTVLDVLGRPREWRGEVYVSPIIVKRVDDPASIFLRTLELLRKDLVFKIIPDRPRTPREEILKILSSGGPRDPAYLSERLGLDVGEVEEILSALEEEGLIRREQNGKYSMAGEG
ncbi:MAG TPA: ArsR family transcriptional regulator, partial [Candidatus Korarchaeota archaeon]|nr:ArsR family transcriptional regulator [Candidatus Korarchaeota archaeon]